MPTRYFKPAVETSKKETEALLVGLFFVSKTKISFITTKTFVSCGCSPVFVLLK